MKENHIPAEISNTAGTYVCNHVMYGILYNIEKKYPHMKGGFIHIPYLPSQAIAKPAAPSMALEDIVKGLTVGIQAIGGE